ncbi:PQQ-binding-like beta-propeller repeat protein [Alicyclobacillus sp. SO9]|uniref:outer membrane protein assembly factor BamB family protein n=1 Tax=Alicyclobacillus sp. SO9 TaxID=2665646 RepID=UPI0018E7C278|nr:PQQ-binding-like beta-propeller repeat protein [Alicyclobacillus sp. SO9]QQE79007.1 PQQ-binding-like beta-propeller repeat protein [Alicyclobacillus sp. SO9]
MQAKKWRVFGFSVAASLAVVACAPGGAHNSSKTPANTANSGNKTESKSTANTASNSSNRSRSAPNSNSTTVGGAKTSSSVYTTPPDTGKGPLPGDLLIADRGNSRLLLVTPQKKIIWSMVIGKGNKKGASNRGPDDSFFTPDHKHIIINEEDNQQIDIIDIAQKKIVWHYGHPGVKGSKPGYLNTPDDAYELPNGLVSVADIGNRRILFINPKTKKIVKQFGTTYSSHRFIHNPPKYFDTPNGDTPVSHGDTLVTEINGSYADLMSPTGKLIYTVHLPNMSYPSDTQQLQNGNLLVVSYQKPGRVEEVTPKGKVVWTYYKTSGPGMLNHPSLALPLPNGNVVLNDDYNDRVVVINPKSNKIVWQYGHTGVSGTKAGYLNTPDGLDLAPGGIQIPTK